MQTSTPLAVVAAIILNTAGEVLLAQRPAGKHLAGYWEFPGGKVEKNEQPRDALTRELKEELDLDVHVQHELGRFDFAYEWGVVALKVFIVQALGVPKTSADVQVFRWIKLEQVSQYPLAPADVRPWQCYLASRPKTQTV